MAKLKWGAQHHSIKGSQGCRKLLCYWMTSEQQAICPQHTALSMKSPRSVYFSSGVRCWVEARQECAKGAVTQRARFFFTLPLKGKLNCKYVHASHAMRSGMPELRSSGGQRWMQIQWPNTLWSRKDFLARKHHINTFWLVNLAQPAWKLP